MLGSSSSSPRRTRGRRSCPVASSSAWRSARALINKPDVLLLDEPLGALDLKLRRQMQIELKRIQVEIGLTFVHVTHDQEEAMTMADTIAVMNKGIIEQMGAPAELYENPRRRSWRTSSASPTSSRVGRRPRGDLVVDANGTKVAPESRRTPTPATGGSASGRRRCSCRRSATSTTARSTRSPVAWSPTSASSA